MYFPGIFVGFPGNLEIFGENGVFQIFVWSLKIFGFWRENLKIFEVLKFFGFKSGNFDGFCMCMKTLD